MSRFLRCTAAFRMFLTALHGMVMFSLERPLIISCLPGTFNSLVVDENSDRSTSLLLDPVKKQKSWICGRLVTDKYIDKAYVTKVNVLHIYLHTCFELQFIHMSEDKSLQYRSVNKYWTYTPWLFLSGGAIYNLCGYKLFHI